MSALAREIYANIPPSTAEDRVIYRGFRSIMRKCFLSFLKLIITLDDCPNCKKSVMLCGFADEIVRFLDSGCDTCNNSYTLESEFVVIM